MAIHKSVFDKGGTREGVNPGATAAQRPLERMNAKSIMGYEIRNPEGEDLGKVKDVMINLEKGQVEYVVVEFGTFMGMGGKYFAVPFRELKPDSDHRFFILNRDKEYLKKSPGFDKDHWPQTNDHSYFNNVTMYYGSYLPPFP